MGFKALTLLVVLVLGFALSLMFYFWQPSNITPHSLAFYLKVPSTVRSFPLWHPANDPLYRVRYADGEKPSYTGLNYRTNLSDEELHRELDAASFDCEVSAPYQGICNKHNMDGSSIQLTYQTTSGSDNYQLEFGFFNY